MTATKKLKRFNGIFYWIALCLLILNLTDSIFRTKIFAFLTHTSFSNYLIGYFCLLVFFLSVISLFKEKIFFSNVPYNFYTLYVLLTVGVIVLAYSEF
jgi:hypothetical protein